LKRITYQELRDAAKRIIELSQRYSSTRKDAELWFDGLTYGYLDGRFGGMQRQHNVRSGRIDFRQSCSRPVVIELVVRTPKKANALDGSQNDDELKKLTKSYKASTRYLLLLDTCPHHLERGRLRATYARKTAGRGHFARKRVTVLYTHGEDQFKFLWPTKG